MRAAAFHAYTPVCPRTASKVRPYTGLRPWGVPEVYASAVYAKRMERTFCRHGRRVYAAMSVNAARDVYLAVRVSLRSRQGVVVPLV